MRAPRLTEVRSRSDAWKASRRRRRKKDATPETIVEDRGGLFGTVTEQVVEVRPRPKKGRRGSGDEAVVVRRERSRTGKVKKRTLIVKPI